jgi:type II secretory pathway pseudopilin PulG
MRFSADDLGKIKWSLLTCLLSTGIAVGLINYSASTQKQSLRQLQQAQKQLNTAREQLLTAQSDLENMSSYQLEYDALVTQKVIGNEQRLDWIEGLDNLRKQGLLPDFKYTIGPQSSYAPNPPLNAGNFALTLSPMSMELDLLHEGQLLNFFGALSRQMPGWFLLDKCALSRSSAAEDGGVMLKANCSGGWFTMKNRSAP